MKKTLLLLLAAISMSAHAESLTVTHKSQGAFPTELEAALTEAGLTAAQVTDLSVVSTGAASMNADDIAAIRTTLTAVQNVDLSKSFFPSGGYMPNTTFATNQSFLSGMTSLVSVTLPEQTIRISVGAFNGCTNLTTVNFPSKLTVIEGYAFRETKVAFHELPEGINWGNTGWTFSACYQMRDFVIPEDMTKVANAMFYLTGDANTRTITCRQLTPPTSTIATSGYNGSFGNRESYPNYTLKVLRSCVETYSAATAAPWNTMKVQELPNTLFTIDYTTPDAGTVSNFNEPLFDGKIAIYADKNKLKFLPNSGYELYQVKIDGELIYDCKTSENTEALENLVYPMTRAEGEHVLTVYFADPNDISTVVNEIADDSANLTFDGSSVASSLPGISVYDTTGKIVISTSADTLSLQGIAKGIYIVRNAAKSLKIRI